MHTRSIKNRYSMEDQLTKKQLREKRTAEKHSRKEHNENRARNKKIVFMSVLILATVAMIWGVAASQKSTVIKDISPDPSRGPADAKVVITEYADFECPACAATYPVLDGILKEYEGKVLFKYNDFPLPQHANAVDAAIAGQCAFDQGKFFEMHDKLYDTQKDWESLGQQEARDTFAAYAKDLGVDMTAFESCKTGDSATARINEDVAEARSAKVNSTPTFFVNGVRLVTSPFATNLRKAIDEALAKAQ